jgi:hypothetical protein
MNLIDATKSYADQMEAIGIVRDWIRKSDKPNEKLNRLAYLLSKMVFRINSLEYEIDDLKFLNEELIDKKNREILKLITRNGHEKETS